jgi:hypothetical protein
MSDIELLVVLLIVGGLFLASIRLRARKSNIMLILIVAVLVVALMALSKLTMTLFGATIVLGALVIVFVLVGLRHSWSHLLSK